MTESRQLVLARRPVGQVRDEDFEMRTGPIPDPGDGELVVRVCWLSFDPAQRGWMDEGPSYIPPVAIGEPMRATGVGQVVASRHDGFAVGDLVSGTFGWQEHALSDGSGSIVPVEKVPDGVGPTAALGPLGTTGMTAYFGMLEIGRPSAGEIVVVSGAAGATGSIAGQLAKLRGARTIGIAGGEEKCEWLTAVAGFDGAIDYKAGDVGARIRELAPGGVDVYYDNVGGQTLDSVLLTISHGARIVCCGSISTRFSNASGPQPGIQNLSALIVRSARMQGFILLDYADRFDEAKATLSAHLTKGELVAAEDVREGGLEQAPETLRRLFEGRNLGKQLLRISSPE
jgi:NADPH-dependent curcumin reductase CurA